MTEVINSTRVKVYYGDTDCGGVVYYANYLQYFEMGRTEYMNSRGVSVKSLMEKGVFFVVKKAEVEYISPAGYGDTLEIQTVLSDLKGARIAFSYRIMNAESGSETARGNTVLACTGKNLKPVRIPGEIRKKLE